MFWLNPGRWLLYAAFLGALWLGMTRLQQIGYDRAQAEYTAAAEEAQAAYRAKESELNATNRKLQNDLLAAKNRHADAVVALDNAERLFDATLGAGSSSTATTTATVAGIDAGPGPERYLLGQCASALAGLAKTADGLEIQIVGLQSYVKNICLAR